MTTIVPNDQWLVMRTSVKETGDRFAELVARASDPRAKATPHWTVVDTAAHVATVAALHNSCLPGGSLSLDGPDLAYRVQMTTVDTVSALNDYAMGHFTERDRHVLVDRLRSEVGRLLELSDGVDPDSAVPWLGSRVCRSPAFSRTS